MRFRSDILMIILRCHDDPISYTDDGGNLHASTKNAT